MTQAQDLRRYDPWTCASSIASINLSCCLPVFLVRGDIHCAGGVPAGVVFSPHC